MQGADKQSASTQSPKSIGRRLIALTLVQLVVVIAFLSTLNILRTRAEIDRSITRLRGALHTSIRDGASEQLGLLSHAARVLLLINDYSTLQTIVGDLARQRRYTAVVVSNSRNIVVAHGDSLRVGKAPPSGGALDPTRRGEREHRVLKQRSLVLTAPVTHGKRNLGNVLLAVSLADLDKALANARALKQANVVTSIIYTGVIAVVAVLAALGLAVWLSLRITRPIRRLAAHAGHVAEGDLARRAAVDSADEIGQLAERFNYMTERVAVLLEESAAKVALEKELELASLVQSTLVPGGELIDSGNIVVAGHFAPAARCSGDWWGYHRAEDGRELVAIGDATGHGVGPAMLTAVAKGAMSSFMRRPSADVTPSSLLVELDAAVRGVAVGGGLRMTCLVLLFAADGRSVTIANAGHSFPYLVRAGEGKLSAVIARGSALGARGDGERLPTFKEVSRDLEPGDALMLYTDGLVECIDRDGAEYGARRLRALFEEHSASTTEGIRDAVLDDLRAFCGECNHEDDVTLVVVKVGS